MIKTVDESNIWNHLVSQVGTKGDFQMLGWLRIDSGLYRGFGRKSFVFSKHFYLHLEHIPFDIRLQHRAQAETLSLQLCEGYREGGCHL